MGTEGWEVWVANRPDRFFLTKPDNPRHELSWKELKSILDHFRSLLDVLDQASDEFRSSAQAAKVVLRSLHKKWMRITRIVKQLHFEPSEEYDNPVSAVRLVKLDET